MLTKLLKSSSFSISAVALSLVGWGLPAMALSLPASRTAPSSGFGGIRPTAVDFGDDIFD